MDSMQKLCCTALQVYFIAACATCTSSNACQVELDAYCNADAACVGTIRKHDFALPLVARNDIGFKSSEKQWRCYSPSSLSADLLHYTNGTAYCSRQTQLANVLDLCTSGAAIVHVNATEVFTHAEVLRCGLIRTPQLVATASGKVLLFAQCRIALSSLSSDTGEGKLGDDFRWTRMVLKESLDGGETWGAMRFVSERGTGVGVAIFDKVSSALVFQYQTMPFTDPYKGNTLWQSVSKDDGVHWSTPRNITHMIAACSTNPVQEMMCGAAGSRVQTSSGRLVFSGHNQKNICVWYSDDSGVTYQTQAQPSFMGNEHSIAQLADGSLYMNGRGNQFPWHGNRTAYQSTDGGRTWTAGKPTPLGDVNCEAAVIAVNQSSHDLQHNSEVLFFSEPSGPGRQSFRIHCSCDGGVTFRSSVIVNPGAVAAYSSLLWVPSASKNHGRSKPKLLAVWEQNPKQLAHTLDTDWCKCMGSPSALLV